jgi:hypothetical protein
MAKRLSAAIAVMLALSIVVLSATVPTARALTVANACKSNATGTFSDLPVALVGSSSPSPVAPGGSLTLTGLEIQTSVPATLLIAGYNLGLLAVGSNAIPVKAWVAVQATNTTEGVKVFDFTETVSTTITDPNGVPGTGDESATPLSVTKTLPDSTWTPVGSGTVEFSQAGPGSLPVLPAGAAAPGTVTPLGSAYFSAQVAGGLIRANFDCQAGTSSVDGTSFTPATPGSFLSVTVEAAPPSTVTTIPSVSTTTQPGATTTTGPATTTTAPATTTTAAPVTTTTAPATTTTAVVATTTTTAPPVPTDGSGEYDASCTNSVTPDPSQLRFAASGTVLNPVDAGTAFVVTEQDWRVTIPASVFQAGLNFGLLTAGQTIDGSVTIVVAATNTVETTREAKLDVQVPVNVQAGQALAAVVDLPLPDQTWTAVSGPIDFSFRSATVSVDIGLPNPVAFSCTPTAAGPYLSTSAVGTTTLTTTTISGVASQPPAPPRRLPTTGADRTVLVQALVALLLLDLGYLALSSLRPARRGAR